MPLVSSGFGAMMQPLIEVTMCKSVCLRLVKLAPYSSDSEFHAGMVSEIKPLASRHALTPVWNSIRNLLYG